MAVYDRWHKSYPKPDDMPCKCGTKQASALPVRQAQDRRPLEVVWRDE